jgi:hypothetical protein
VLIVHGNHAMSRPSEPGNAYLGEHLASHGYLVAAIDEKCLNGLFFCDGQFAELPLRAWLILQHLQAWRHGNELRCLEPQSLRCQRVAQDGDRLGADAVDGEQFLLGVGGHQGEAGDAVVGELAGGRLADPVRQVADRTYVGRGRHRATSLYAHARLRDDRPCRAALRLLASGPMVWCPERLGSRAHVDEVRAWVREAGFALLYDERFPFATAPGYYAVFCEDPDRIKLEVVAPREP